MVSAVTAQNTVGVDSLFPVDRNAFEKQLRILLSDIRPDAVKIGMLYSTWAVDFLAELFSRNEFGNIVNDPVTVSSSGMSLVDEGTLELIRSRLFPSSRVITPNIYEATVSSSRPDEVNKVGFFGGTAEEAKTLALRYPGACVDRN